MNRFQILLLIIGFAIFVSYSFYNTKKKSNPVSITEPTNLTLITGNEVVKALDSLGYFKFTEPKNLDTLKKEIETTYDKYKVLTTINYEKSPFEPFCLRYYSCDGETLFELDGITDYLKEIKPTFNKLGIPLVWSDDYFSEDATEHTIIINAKKYIAFKGDPNDLRIWGIATKNFVEILNDQLSIHNSSERVYPLMYNNDTHIVFLTKPQYEYIFQHFDKKERPMEVSLWWEIGNK